VQSLVSKRQLSAGHARALAGLGDARFAEYIAKRAAAEGWSVRQVEEAARARSNMPEGQALDTTMSEPRPAAIVELEQRLTDKLNAEVDISYRQDRDRGRVVIKFTSIEDLERIYRVLHE